MTTTTAADRAAVLVGVLVERAREVARAQAALASAMVEFAAVRRGLDAERIGGIEALGGEAPYVAAEFACDEIGLALACSTWQVQRTAALTRRVQTLLPSVWEAWVAGDIDQEKVRRIDAGLRRLSREDSQHLLDQTVVDVAVCKSPELLGRWVNRLVARLEPDAHDGRYRAAYLERYVSLRADLDGMSHLSAVVTSLDAAAVDAVLTAVATGAGRTDPRSMQQRRADALVDLLLGRISNAHDGSAGCVAEMPRMAVPEHGDRTASERFAESPLIAADRAPEAGAGLDGDWELPASAFRPDPAASPDRSTRSDQSAGPERGDETGNGPPGDLPVAAGRDVPTPPEPGPGGRAQWPKPIPVSIGVVVPVQSLLGLSDAPGELVARSGTVPAQVVRELARQEGTLFWRLLTDERGTLLDATEIGRFPSARLGTALDLRAGTCTKPTCTVPAARCDHDHHTPYPAGPTTAANLDPKCRRDHRAKTHAGHHTRRVGDTTEWRTPTGHTYQATDDPLPTAHWPDPHPVDVSWVEERFELVLRGIAA